MAMYEVICAYLADTHEHVIGLQVRKHPKKATGSPKAAKYMSKKKVTKKIENDGDFFFTVSRDSSAQVHVVHEPCPDPTCSEEVLRTTADGKTTDNLDYLRCP